MTCLYLPSPTTTEAPEEEYDPRTLYERLQEHKMKKQAELEESQKLSSMIRGLESDEVSFLEEVDKNRMQEAHQRMKEEEDLLKEYEQNSFQTQSTLTEEEHRRKIQELKEAMFKKKKESPPGEKKMTGQAALLAKVVKRKQPDDQSSRQEDTNKRVNQGDELEKLPSDAKPATSLNNQSLKVVGILPGIGVYGDSSDSENSDSDSDIEVTSIDCNLILHVPKNSSSCQQ